MKIINVVDQNFLIRIKHSNNSSFLLINHIVLYLKLQLTFYTRIINFFIFKDLNNN